PSKSFAFSFYLRQNENRYITVFTWERIPSEANGEASNTFAIAPDWTIEILSPDQSQTKVTQNILRCLKQGTQMGWLIAPEEKTEFIS
ncbi:MAG TPA: hypothetical protein DCZ88_00445, partial [Pseudanabaena sp.]|nr:hypothetical protein [Pseudanabaena sp.]